MPDSTLDISTFTGLNTREASTAIGPKELSSVKNFNLGNSGQLEKRTGFIKVNTGVLSGVNASIQIIGFFNTDTYKQFIARDGTNLYTSTDAKVWTVMPGGPWNDVQHGVQYTDKFYMVRKVGTVIEWNGISAAGIVNSPAGTFCKIFKDRLFVINSEGVGSVASRIYFSNALDLSSTGWPATNYVGVQEGDGDRLIGISIVSDYLLVFKNKAIWNLFVQGPDTLSWILRPFRSDTGCISKYSILSREGITFFCGLDGIYTTDGSDVKLISAPVGNFFDLVTVDLPTINQVSAFFWKNMYVVAFPAYGSAPIWTTFEAAGTWDQLSAQTWAPLSSVNNYLVFHINQKGWTQWEFLSSGLSPHIFTSVVAVPDLKGVYCGERDATGRVLRFGDVIHTDFGFPIDVSIATKDFDMEKPIEKKRGKWIGVELAGAGAFTFKSVIDQTGIKMNVITVATESEVKVAGPGYFRNWRFEMSASTSAPLSVYRISMQTSAAEYRPIKKSVI